MVLKSSRWLLFTGLCLTGSLTWSPAMADDTSKEPASAIASDATENGESAGDEAAAPMKSVIERPAADIAPSAAGTTSSRTVAGSDAEAITERYPDGKIKIQREVVRDADDNYVNHGLWKMMDRQGRIVAEGHYVNGRRQGAWIGLFQPGEAELFSDTPFKDFTGPLKSQAEFDNGRLNGTWVIYDNKQHKITEWNYAEGHRHGKWTSWYANGRKMREVNYVKGELNGQAREWSPEGSLIVDDLYQSGRKLARKIEYHAGNQKKSDGMYLFAKQALQQDDDWWNSKLAKFTTLGRDERHGEWSAWHSNGQVQMRGRYEHDAPSGEFTWWYPTGQTAVKGNYLNGQRNGEWTWYHENGQKSTFGDFVMGGPNGRWIWWNDNGRVSQKVEYAQGKGEPVKKLADKIAPPADPSAVKRSSRPGTNDAATQGPEIDDFAPQSATAPASKARR